MKVAKMSAQAPKKQWLTLAEASALLGVHRATLRTWADEGHVRAFRTPGGHRRFLAAEIQALVATAGEPKAPAEDSRLARDLLNVARRELSSLQGAGNAWLEAFPAGERDPWRESGRRLVGLAIQYVSRRDGREAVINEARAIGTLYGQKCAASRVSLANTVRALLFFRESLLRSTRPGLVVRGQYDEEDARIHREMRELLDQVLYATLNAFEQASLSLPRGPA